MKLELVEDLAGLREREAAWSALHGRLPAAGVFTSPGWVLNWIENFAPDTRLRCLFASDRSGLRAVLPLLPVATQWRRIPVTALTACTNAHSVRSALLFDPADRERVFAGLADALRDDAGWDMLLLDGCDTAQGEGVVPPLPRELPAERWQHYALAVHGTWANYHAALSRDLRRNLRRAESDLHALGRVRFDVEERDADGLFEQWVQVDRASWKADGGETVDHNPQTRAYYRDMLRGLAAGGRLLGLVLRLDDTPVGVLVCLRDKGVLCTLKTATRADLSTARLSLGALLVAELLQRVWARQDVRLVDFVNKQPYTERWTRQTLEFERRVSFAPSWRGQAAVWMERAYQRVTRHRAAAAAAVTT
jgi:hypothetical protein